MHHSVLSPMGPEAARIAELSWLLFLGGAAIFLLVMLLLALALGGGPGVRRRLGARRAILAGGVAFPVLVLSALLVHTLGVAAALGLGEPAPLRIEVTGRQYWWEVRYPDREVVTANEIHIPVGRAVELLVDSGDVIHSFWVPSLHGKIDMIPGRVNRRRFSLDRPGVLRGQCAEFCGTQHALMAFFVVAEEEAEFERWLERLRAPVAKPEEPFLAQGWQAFGQAGCGACHAVRGTPWAGRSGPDLTLLGGRLSLAAGTLDNHLATLAGWIAGPQDIKPGNRMPAFNTVLDGPELRAVAAWLESLR
ncbi:c-type cytochrome [Belnapia sp. T6]|uniref:C-type cytochrome n=1 Tax=Belnapia mucosa TaxID=2804532 RepID=A0ABS1V1X2_9PROT|nr:c-type cytochrome [Belnapia mucosa]MBL6455272.1 c-type cytochrome [Belnapia mucosa]